MTTEPVQSDDSPPSSVLLVLGGEIPRREQVDSLLHEAMIIVAADAGALALDSIGVLPQVVIGDLDSLGPRVAEFQRRGVEVVRVENQDETDFEKSLRWILEAEYTDVTIIGCSGGLIDHSLNNFSVLGRWGSRLQMRVIDQETIGHVVTKEISLRLAIATRLSLIGLPEATVTTSGLAWELQRETLRFGLRDGVSNKSTAEHVTIAVTDGVLLVVVPHAARPSPY